MCGVVLYTHTGELEVCIAHLPEHHVKGLDEHEGRRSHPVVLSLVKATLSSEVREVRAAGQRLIGQVDQSDVRVSGYRDRSCFGQGRRSKGTKGTHRGHSLKVDLGVEDNCNMEREGHGQCISAVGRAH